LAELGYTTVDIPMAVFKGNSLKTDSEGTPILSLTFEVKGRNITECLNVADIASLVGKPVTLKIKDHQQRIKE
jgi:hypothetical protein